MLRELKQKQMNLLYHQIHLHRPHFTEYLKKEINSIYFVHSIRGFVFSLFGIFVPVYLLTLDFSLVFILIFFATRQLTATLFSVFVIGPIANRYGLKHTMLASLPLALVYLIMLAILEFFTSLPLLFVVAFFGGIQASLYWVPLHSLFARCTKTGHRSSQVGKMLSLQHIAGLLAPLLGGFVSVIFGFEVLFAIGFLLLLFPIGILLYTPEIKPHVNYDLKKGFLMLKKHRKHFFRTWIENIGNASDNILWPIFTFLVIADKLAVGIVGTLMGMGTVIFTLLIGRSANRHNRSMYIKVAAVMLGVLWIGKFFASTKILIYILSTFAGFFVIMFSVPHSAETYELARKEKHVDEFIIFRDIPIALGKVFILFIAFLAISKIELSFLTTGLNFLLVLFL